jgi:hypothetical protein
MVMWQLTAIASNSLDRELATSWDAVENRTLIFDQTRWRALCERNRR